MASVVAVQDILVGYAYRPPLNILPVSMDITFIGDTMMQGGPFLAMDCGLSPLCWAPNPFTVEMMCCSASCE
jgi:hypothetical protein